MMQINNLYRSMTGTLSTSSASTSGFHVSYEAPPQRSPYCQGVTHTLALVLITTLAVSVVFG